MRQKNYGRFLYLILLCVIDIPTGSAAIWSVFQPYAKEMYHIGTGMANFPFSMYMAGFVLGNMLGGKLQQKMKASAVVSGGGVLLAVGMLLAAFVPAGMPWGLAVTFGLMGGLGGGCGYNVMISVVGRWFPDMRGLATGIVVGLVGANGLILSPFVNRLLKNFGFSKSMMIMGIAFLIVTGLGGFLVKNPPEGYKKDVKVHSAVNESKREFTAKEALRTKDFYMISGAMALGTMAYFMINPMVKSLGTERGLTDAAAVSAVMLMSAMNCAGRIAAPAISDRTGRKKVLGGLFVLVMASVLGMTFATGGLYIAIAGAVAFTYGGFFGIFPMVVADRFGKKNQGLNYGLVMTGYGILCLVCPLLVSVGVGFAFAVSAVSAALGMLLVVKL